MSRKRAKYLVDLAKKEKNSLKSFDKNGEIPFHTDERESSPLPAEVDNTEFVALYNHVIFEEPIQEHDYSIVSSIASRDIENYKNDINLNDLGAPKTPLNIYSPNDFNPKTFSIDINSTNYRTFVFMRL
ncbi:unnamed protein product [Parnassius apollo]|uniref:(apollo) hypothetical protein n=1 Tax=Parnassius apollo TaxID=110799 RepID=A0A8S3XCD0_PARAO|nr:unnamed protein product [Parnassius apollo]